MALSSIEVEYCAFTHTTIEVAWMKTLFTKLGLEILAPPIIWCDNQSVLALSSNLMFHARTRHIEIDVYYIKDQVANHQKTDILTKALPTHKFEYFKNTL